MRIAVLIVALVISSPASAQTKKTQRASVATPPCSITIDEIPTVRGLRLGQPFTYLDKVIPRYSEPRSPGQSELGLREIAASGKALQSYSGFDGVDFIWLTYFDDSLVSFQIHYLKTAQWPSNLHFVAAMAEHLKLPRNGWHDRNPTWIECRGFFVKISLDTDTNQGTLQMTDSSVYDELVKRNKNIQESKRARFRP